jgi:hypothetical protein
MTDPLTKSQVRAVREAWARFGLSAHRSYSGWLNEHCPADGGTDDDRAIIEREREAFVSGWVNRGLGDRTRDMGPALDRAYPLPAPAEHWEEVVIQARTYRTNGTSWEGKYISDQHWETCNGVWTLDLSHFRKLADAWDKARERNGVTE